jgi:carbamoyltransferase
MTAILGISAFYHDSAAALLVDGEIVAAAQEERFTRIKHDHDFPTNAIAFCLDEAGLTQEQIDYVGFYDKPLLKFERLLETYLAVAPQGFRSFVQAMGVWLGKKLHLRRELNKGLQGRYKKRYIFPQHHESHAASAFFPSPFEEAAILTMDGVGEWATASMGVGRDNQISLHKTLSFPHSLGLLYSAFTYYTGFKVNSGEYKLMGLAPYGEPRYVNEILQHLMDLKEDGSFRLNMSYFNYCQGLTMTSPRFHRLFGGPPRAPESEITQREMDLAASIQNVTEEVVLRSARTLHKETGLTRLCMAGGVSLNCVANGHLLREGPFEELWIQPAAGDAGGALGVAQFIWHQLLEQPRSPDPCIDSQHGSALGPAFDNDEIRSFLEQQGCVFEEHPNADDLCNRVCELLEDKQVVGWFQGRMEFGPRALGYRSILADARDPEMQARVNLKIKFRESFRPFAPSVLRERAFEYFDIEAEQESPYMLLVTDIRPDKRLSLTPEQSDLKGFERRTVPLSVIPAVTHVDGSARLQTVDDRRNPCYARLLRTFEERTGCPLLVNTSFNVRGEPIVCTPEDAFRCFLATDMDVLVLEHHVLLKNRQPDHFHVDREQHLSQFALD